jgi:hypothetical protein
LSLSFCCFLPSLLSAPRLLRWHILCWTQFQDHSIDLQSCHLPEQCPCCTGTG